MPENNVNLDALNKLNIAFRYAEAAKNAGSEKAVLYLENGQKLKCRYSQDDAPKDILHFRRTRTENQKQLNNETREIFKQMVIDIFGTSIDDVPKNVRSALELSKYDNTGRPLTARRVMAVNKAILAAMKGVNKLIGLSGDAAGKVAAIIANGSGILDAEDPANELQVRSNRIAKAQFITHIAKEIGVNLKKQSRVDEGTAELIVSKHTQFDMDLQRNEIVKLRGKQMTVDPNKARDELVQFITDEKDATFDDASNQTKMKACILMAVIQQGTFGCVIAGVGHAFHREGKYSRLLPGSMRNLGGGQQQSFSLTKDKEGSIKMSCVVKYTGPAQLGLKDKDGKWFPKATDAKGFIEYRMETKFTEAELDWLAMADWSGADYDQIDKIENDETIPNHLEAAADLVPDDLKFTGDVKVSCRVHANAISDI
ncbi:MAG: hypothetical protein IJS15_12960 [Victivallales bacterium]|nr:hypothetical protein [Victivallales bacterium]